MEKKSKYRILGILIVMGLVVIALPLFQSEKEEPSDLALMKAPPFPDPIVQVTESTTKQPAMDQQLATVESQSTPEKQQVEKQAIDTHDFQSDRSLSGVTLSPLTINKQASDSAVTLSTNEVLSLIDKNTVPIKKSKPFIANNRPSITKAVMIKHGSTTKKTTVKLTKSSLTKIPLDNNGLIHFKQAVWVIQLGSFKDKSAALRLTNQLRSSGYRAFMQQVSTSFGNSTRVFVGPEYRQDMAFALAEQLQNHLHMRGVVMSYKPLTI
ncbi:MAG: hypothetical protein A3F11_09955 [Gammaproteobacteria bacterium RIFCSPHIGHO2_12_FULL_37_14]|nr:MAG: hypothetical protein A3F11_09955 [Gammaproteobacteria bacterium RIFCSPHIGHO2_12_FULL_37_14]